MTDRTTPARTGRVKVPGATLYYECAARARCC